MASGRLFLIGIFIALPIILEAQHNPGYYLPKWLSHSSVNGKHPEKPEVIITELLYYNPVNVRNGEVVSRYQAADEESHKHTKFENIIFPDDKILHERLNDDNKEDEVFLTPSCKEKNFCLNEPHYPTSLVNEMLNVNPNLQNYATADFVEVISHRIDSGDDELCQSRVQLINPRSAKNIEDDWLFIVQSKESNFTQSIRVEVCETEDTACEKIEGFALGYKTKCRQKYIYRQLTALSHEGNIIQDLFPIPASCCCHLIKDEIYRTKNTRTITRKNRV